MSDPHRMSHRTRLSVIVLAGTVLFAPLAGADEAGAVQFKEQWKDLVNLFGDDDPCLGGAVTIETVSNGVIHATFFTEGKHAGEHKVTITDTGKATVTPDDPGLPTYAGRFTFWGGDNQNYRSGASTFTFSATLNGSDGSTVRIVEVFHINVTPDGIVHSTEKVHTVCA